MIAKKRLQYSQRPSIYTFVQKIGRNEGEDTYQVVSYIGFPSMILMLRMITDFMFNFKNLESLILPYVLGLFVLIIVLSAFYRVFFFIPTRRKRVYFEILIILLCYNFGLVYGINCVYDRAIPRKFPSIIVDKEYNMSTGSHKRLTYYIDLITFNTEEELIKLKVSNNYYQTIEIKDTVMLFERGGFFNIPYYSLK